MGFHLGDVFPNFQCRASGHDDKFDFYNYLEDSWGILFSHPNDFTPVCTTELGAFAKMNDEFEKRDCKLVGLSCNDVETHECWGDDVMHMACLPGKLPFPIISDKDRILAYKLGIMDPVEKGKDGLPLTCRCVFVISPKKIVMASILYPATTGRSVSEILRMLDSLQLTSKNPVATPEGWTKGKKVMVVPSLSDEEAKKKFPKGFETVSLPSEKGYVRLTPDPRY